MTFLVERLVSCLTKINNYLFVFIKCIIWYLIIIDNYIYKNKNGIMHEKQFKIIETLEPRSLLPPYIVPLRFCRIPEPILQLNI